LVTCLNRFGSPGIEELQDEGCIGAELNLWGGVTDVRRAASTGVCAVPRLDFSAMTFAPCSRL
jgi:hypothetical protein